MPGTTKIAREYSASTANEYVLVIDGSVTESSSLGATQFFQDAGRDARSWIKSSGVGIASWLQGSFQIGTSTRPSYAGGCDFDVIVSISRSRTQWATLEKGLRELSPSSHSGWVMFVGEAGSGLIGEEESITPDRDAALAVARAKDIVTRLGTAAEIGEDEAIELVYDQIYKQIESPVGVPVINEFLRILNPKRHRNSVLLSILTVTGLADVRECLTTRAQFFNDVKSCLTARAGAREAEELLTGLE